MPFPAKLSIDAIASAAQAIVDEEGLAALGVRPVAERLGVRPSALYRYCGDGLGLVALVAEAGAQSLRERATAALDAARRASGAREPREELRILAEAYRTFAAEKPALYAAIITDTTPSLWREQPGRERKALWNLLLQQVGGVTGDPDDTSAAVALWSFLHGYVSLGNAGLFGASGPKDGFALGIAAMCAGLASSR